MSELESAQSYMYSDAMVKSSAYTGAVMFMKSPKSKFSFTDSTSDSGMEYAAKRSSSEPGSRASASRT